MPGGTHLVQLLRTYPNLRHGRDYPFARGGERSVARGYTKALERAERLIYVEDQYLWSTEIAATFADALRRRPELRVIAVLPHLPDQSAPLSRVPQELGRHDAVTQLLQAGGERVAIYGIENHQSRPVYVHAKVCVIDDWWATIGSDNFNRRSWTHDSELSAVVLDTTGGDHSAYARRLRLTLGAEHLDRRLGPDDYPGDISALEPRPHPRRCWTTSRSSRRWPTASIPTTCSTPSPPPLPRCRTGTTAAGVGERPPGRLRPLRRVHAVSAHASLGGARCSGSSTTRTGGLGRCAVGGRTERA